MSISEWLSCFQRESNAFLRFALAAERKEGFAFQIEQILFADKGPGREAASAKDADDMIPDFCIVVADVFGLAH